MLVKGDTMTAPEPTRDEMSPPPPRPTRQGISTRLLIAAGTALALLAAGLGVVVTLALRPSRPATLTAAAPTGDRAGSAAALSVPRGFASPAVAAVAAHVPPVEVAVPAIRVRSRLIGLRLNNDGTLQVPADYGVAGWYSDGPAPGDAGPPAVIVGHVDSQAGPGIFYRLPEVRRGDVVLVRRADGSDVRFTVYATTSFAKASFPAEQVYAARPTPELRLITCTGAFDRRTGHYLDNRVVYARITPLRPRGTSSVPAPVRSR